MSEPLAREQGPWQGWRRRKHALAMWEKSGPECQDRAEAFNVLMRLGELSIGPGDEKWEYQILPVGRIPQWGAGLRREGSLLPGNGYRHRRMTPGVW